MFWSLPANVAERLCHLHTCIAQGGTKCSLNATSGLIRLVMDLEIRGVYGALEYLILGCKTSNRYAGTDNVKVLYILIPHAQAVTSASCKPITWLRNIASALAEVPAMYKHSTAIALRSPKSHRRPTDTS